jgi:hypothetical protein
LDTFSDDPEGEFDWLFGIKVAAELAKAESNEELIIDLINNGGGSVHAYYVMNNYLYRCHPDVPSFMSYPCKWYMHICSLLPLFTSIKLLPNTKLIWLQLMI